MKNLQQVAVVGLVVCIFFLPTMAQTKKWTYNGDNGAQGKDREEITITITQGPKGYEVSGELRRGDKRCPVRGSYSPANERLRARADCVFTTNVGVTHVDVPVEGFKRGKDALRMTEPWVSIARLEGTKPKPQSSSSSGEKKEGCDALPGTWTWSWGSGKVKKGEEETTIVGDHTMHQTGNAGSWTCGGGSVTFNWKHSKDTLKFVDKDTLSGGSNYGDWVKATRK